MTFLETKFGLEGKTAIITGGGGTLCSTIAEGYIKAGANVILWDIRQDALDDEIEKIVGNYPDASKISSVQVDLMQEDSIRKGLDESIKKFGKVDILINGAGGTRGKCPFVDIKEEDFIFVLKLNLIAGCILSTKHVAGYWVKNNIKGVVINIASMAGFNPLSGVWAYSAAKAAVINQTMAQAKEFASSCTV